MEALRNAGHDVVWVRTEAPGAADERFMGMAHADGRVLVTFDKDFGEMVLKRGITGSHG